MRVERVEVHIHVQGVTALDDLMHLSDQILDGAAADPDYPSLRLRPLAGRDRGRPASTYLFPAPGGHII